jgi:hypothetical protein
MPATRRPSPACSLTSPRRRRFVFQLATCHTMCAEPVSCCVTGCRLPACCLWRPSGSPTRCVPARTTLTLLAR